MRKDRLFRVGLVGEAGVVGTTVIVAIMVVFVCRTIEKCCPRRGLFRWIRTMSNAGKAINSHGGALDARCPWSLEAARIAALDRVQASVNELSQ